MPDDDRRLVRRLIEVGKTYHLGSGAVLQGPPPRNDPPPEDEQVGDQLHEGGPGNLIISGPLGEILGTLTIPEGFSPREALLNIARIPAMERFLTLVDRTFAERDDDAR
jgi:hypothetical protein